MASDQSYVEYICEQADLAGALSYKKMFGEYALYLKGKVVALVCDNQLFLKPTIEGREILGAVSERPPYPGAKPHFLIGDDIDDREVLRRLLTATARVFPLFKSKTTKSKHKTRTKSK